MEPRTRRPRTKYGRCAHCGRQRLSKHIEWHPGIEHWQCSNFSNCDDAAERRRLRKLSAKYVVIDYTNWRKQRRSRKIVPISVRFGSSDYHREPQWLLQALDLETGKEKEFSMKDIHSWRPA